MKHLHAAIFILATSTAVAPGFAQIAEGSAASAQPPSKAPADPDRPPLQLGGPSKATPILPVFEPIARPAQALFKAGILLRGTFNNDFQGNPVGGLEHGTANGGTGTFGADFQLGKLIGIQGGQFHLLFADTYGTTLQSKIGNYIKSQGWYYPFQRLELAQLAYEQDLFGGTVNLYGGRTNATAMFARPTYGCNFISGSQCPYYLPLFTGGFSGFPYATWGGRIRVNPKKSWYVEGGVFSVDPNRRNVHGFNLNLDTASGIVAPFEIGYETDFSNDKYPRHFKFGGWYNNAPSIDPLLNTRHLSRALVPGAPLMNTFGRGGLYALADQVIYRPDNSRRNLAIFASVAAPFDQREIFSSQSVAGALFTGPFASRPRDTLGIMVTRVQFTKPETLYMNQLLAKNGSTSFVKRTQYDIEANYGIRVLPGFSLTPNVEYIVNPDTTQRPDARFAPKDAFIAGVRITFNLGDLLGLPSVLPGTH